MFIGVKAETENVKIPPPPSCSIFEQNVPYQGLENPFSSIQGTHTINPELRRFCVCPQQQNPQSQGVADLNLRSCSHQPKTLQTPIPMFYPVYPVVDTVARSFTFDTVPLQKEINFVAVHPLYGSMYMKPDTHTLSSSRPPPPHKCNASQCPPIGVFWDIENCGVPRGKSALSVVLKIRECFFRDYTEVEFICVCDVRKESPQIIHVKLRELNEAQVTVVHVAGISKNAADEKLRQAMRRYADSHAAIENELYRKRPALLLISGDVNFASDLSDFRHRKRIHVILLHNKQATRPLLACANEHYEFYYGLQQISLRDNFGEIIKQEEGPFDVMVLGLPHSSTRDMKRVKLRLGRLSDNCGGKIIFLGGKEAIIRFSSTEAAYRAAKRMDGENVLGVRIRSTVLNASTSIPVHSPGRPVFPSSYFGKRTQNSCHVDPTLLQWENSLPQAFTNPPFFSDDSNSSGWNIWESPSWSELLPPLKRNQDYEYSKRDTGSESETSGELSSHSQCKSTSSEKRESPTELMKIPLDDRATDLTLRRFILLRNAILAEKSEIFRLKVSFRLFVECAEQIFSTERTLCLQEFLEAYGAKFGTSFEISKNGSGVPVEHLLTGIRGLVLSYTQDGSRTLRMRNRKTDVLQPWAKKDKLFSSRLTEFCVEIKALLNSIQGCSIQVSYFPRAYKARFDKEFVLSDFGFSSLDAFFGEECGSTVHLVGKEPRLLMLTHDVQMKRFAVDVIRVLKARDQRAEISIDELESALTRMYDGRPMVAEDYGLCTFVDLVDELLRRTSLVESYHQERKKILTLAMKSRDESANFMT